MSGLLGEHVPKLYKQLENMEQTKEVEQIKSSIKEGTNIPIGSFSISSDKTGIYTTFSYWKGGNLNNIGVEENNDSVSKLTINTIDSDAITGTAYLKLKDGSFADIEFRVRNTQ